MYCRLLERGTQASTSAVTASTSGANIAYWSLLRGKSGPPTEVGRFVRTPRTPYAYAPVDTYILHRSEFRNGTRSGNGSGPETLLFYVLLKFPCIFHIDDF